ncbi:MAG TPA: hypothetical protein VNV86_00325, partial [Candidatus Acidoferrum sp.]|nr:hypothetical protein [Candidatus Acidoferrum sp.]
MLEEFRKQTRKDLDAFNEMTRLIEPPAWTKALEITRENVRLDGDAPAASAVIGVLDGSPLFERSEPLSLTRGPNGEGFTIRTIRRPGK